MMMSTSMNNGWERDEERKKNVQWIINWWCFLYSKELFFHQSILQFFDYYTPRCSRCSIREKIGDWITLQFYTEQSRLIKKNLWISSFVSVDRKKMIKCSAWDFWKFIIRMWQQLWLVSHGFCRTSQPTTTPNDINDNNRDKLFRSHSPTNYKLLWTFQTRHKWNAWKKICFENYTTTQIIIIHCVSVLYVFSLPFHEQRKKCQVNMGNFFFVEWKTRKSVKKEEKLYFHATKKKIKLNTMAHVRWKVHKMQIHIHKFN